MPEASVAARTGVDPQRPYLPYRPIYHYFLDSVKRCFDRTALKWKQDGTYRDIPYSELSRAVDELAQALSARGIGRGDRIAIYSYNRPEWVMADMAAMKLGAVVVPIYHRLPVATVEYILKDSDVRLVFVENPELLGIVEAAARGVPGLRSVVTVFEEEHAAGSRPEKTTFGRLRQEGSLAISRGQPIPPAELDIEDLATIVYTSGTTGEPKGVMLTHKNIVSNVLAGRDMFDINQNDVFVSFLPLCHTFERTCGHYVTVFGGGTIAYVESMDTIAADVKIIRPTVLLAVPRLLEKVYQVVTDKVMAGSPFKIALARAALKTYNRYARLKDSGQPIPLLVRLRRRLFRALVVRKFHEISGGRLRIIVSGSAPLSKRLARILHNLEFDVAEGYGLTETSPIVSAATPQHFRVGTVGKAIRDVEIRIGADDEVLVRGPNVMKGYLNKPEETARTIDAEGWLHTGDQGRIDADGYLTITGRIKELIVTSYGKNVAPVMVENEIARSSYVEQVMVYGDRCSYLTALVVPKQAALEHYARTHVISAPDYPALLRHDRIRKLMEKEVQEKTAGLASHEQVKAVALIAEPFTVENDMLTLTMKLRRPKIIERWRRELLALYGEKTGFQG
jgi:long-chain acyl-CoA synthetase